MSEAERIRYLINEVQDHAMQAAKLRAMLADPVAVHLSMLSGAIAKPTVEQIVHIYGAETLLAALTPASGHPTRS